MTPGTLSIRECHLIHTHKKLFGRDDGWDFSLFFVFNHFTDRCRYPLPPSLLNQHLHFWGFDKNKTSRVVCRLKCLFSFRFYPPHFFSFLIFLIFSDFSFERTGDYALESARWLCLLHLRLDRSERGSSRKERWQQKFNNKSIKTLGVEGWERRKINVVMNRKSINNLFIPWHTRKKEKPFREFRHPIFKRFRQVWRMCWKEKNRTDNKHNSTRRSKS